MRAATLACLLACAGALVACPGPPCAVREGATPRCEPLACPRGAVPQGGRCACVDGGRPFLGGCAGEALDRACGPAARPAEGGCALLPCGEGEALGTEDGTCVTRPSLRALAERMQIALEDDETLACAEGARLVAGGDWAACVAESAACGAGARWSADARRCEPLRACAPGEVLDERGGRCVPVVFPSAEGHQVDVAAWTRWVLGPDGGVASSFVCGALALRPWAVARTTDVDLPVELRLQLRFPENDVTQARLELDGGPADEAPVLRALEPLVRGLRGLGGTARTAAVDARVRCVLPLRSRPHAAPARAR
jgi:hypothetical protein